MPPIWLLPSQETTHGEGQRELSAKRHKDKEAAVGDPGPPAMHGPD
jgi:hypothetical protein